MDIFPSLDLLDGAVVRLEQGRRQKVKVYHRDPLAFAAELIERGIRRVHVVDLNAAFGEPRANEGIIRGLARVEGLEVQVGGGVRKPSLAEELFSWGVDRVVIGTLAVEHPEALAELAGAYPGRVTAALDLRGGRVCIKGWVETTKLTPAEAAARLAQVGVERFLVTDVGRDGLRQGVDEDLFRRVRACVPGYLIASGGVKGREDLALLAAIGADAVVVGKAYLEGDIQVEEMVTGR